MAAMHRSFRLLPVVAVAMAVACATAPVKQTSDDAHPTDPAKQPEKKALAGVPGPDEDMLTIDSNGDGKADVFKYYPKGKIPTDPNKPETGGPLLRAERDLNGDNRIDVWTWYNSDGTKQKESFDLDFDGKVDLIVYYEKNLVVKKEYYSSGREKADVYKYYDKGRLVRVERDRKGNGKIDSWEYWDGDQIDRIGEDNDGDGTVDRWIKPKKST
jgi:hypothetical protein